jgi:hypothetical protein
MESEKMVSWWLVVEGHNGVVGDIVFDRGARGIRGK